MTCAITNTNAKADAAALENAVRQKINALLVALRTQIVPTVIAVAMAIASTTLYVR